MTSLQIALLVAFVGFAGCSPEVPKLIPRPDRSLEKIDGDTSGGLEVFEPSVDILFVVDNSGSMSFHQANLIKNIDKFVGAFTKRTNINYHIGVITSSMGYRSRSAECCGKLNGIPAYVDRTTTDGITVLSRNLRAGTDGSTTEMFFDPVVAALSSPMIDNDNAGFLRKEAHLAIVFITDAEDQSSDHNLKETYDFLVNLKGNKAKVLSYGVIVPSSVDNCPRDQGDAPVKIEEFLNLMPNAGHNEYSLCDPEFGTHVAQIANDLVRYVGNLIFLSRPPVLQSIHVKFGTQEILRDVKRGWSFDSAQNAIVFGDDVVWTEQATGTKVKVYYEAVPTSPNEQKP